MGFLRWVNRNALIGIILKRNERRTDNSRSQRAQEATNEEEISPKKRKNSNRFRGSRRAVFSSFFCFFFLLVLCNGAHFWKEKLPFFQFFWGPPPLSRLETRTRASLYRSPEKKWKNLLKISQREGSLRMQYPSREARWRSSRLNNFQIIKLLHFFPRARAVTQLKHNEYIGEVEVYGHPHRIVSFVEELIRKKRNATEEEEQKERLG